MRMRRHSLNRKLWKVGFVERKETILRKEILGSAQQQINCMLVGTCSSNCCCKYSFNLGNPLNHHLRHPLSSMASQFKPTIFHSLSTSIQSIMLISSLTKPLLPLISLGTPLSKPTPSKAFHIIPWLSISECFITTLNRVMLHTLLS